MTDKRFTVPVKYRFSHSKIQLNGEPLTNDELVRILNTNDGAFVENFALKTENEQLKTQLQNTSDQRDEFHRGARENANRVGKLEKENEQLKERIKELQKESYGNLDGINYYQEQNGHLSSKISDLECENEQLKERNDFLRKQLDRVCIDNETMGDKLKQIGRIL